MVDRTRRALMIGAAALAANGAQATPKRIELDWADLIPHGVKGTEFVELRSLFGIVEHGELTTGFDQELGGKVTTEYNGKLVRIPGYTVPIAFDDTGVTVMLLVPYVGACIHVPPPPPNQILLVKVSIPYEMTGYFEPVYVTGIIEAIPMSTDIAEIGYKVTEATIAPYE
ncbi:MAG: DUF3299 domain-containing protein [Pseudomonadota bacterium]